MKATVTIINLSGPTLRESIHDGRRFVGGTMGQSYGIKVENNTGGRILAVITVDGRNVIDSSPGDDAGDGYVISGRSTFICDGWRTSSSNVCEFTLTTPGAGYADSLGDSSNVGVIGVAVFSEQALRREFLRGSAPPPTPIASRSVEPQRMRSAATGFGDDRESHVRTVKFERDGNEPEIHLINYDTIDALVSAGVMIKSLSPGPCAFPKSTPSYCPRPS